MLLRSRCGKLSLQTATISECRYRWWRVPATRHQALENTAFSRAFRCREFGKQYSFVEAAGGKSQRKDDGVTRNVEIKLGRTAANGPTMDWNESSIIPTGEQAACARCVHREIIENLKTTNVCSDERASMSGIGRCLDSLGSRLAN